MVNWQLYFDSIQESYQKWWQVDTIIRVKNDWFSNSSPLEDLQVETVPDETFLGKKDKQPQRLEILAGLRKYSLDSDDSDDSDDHVLLQGKPGSGKSTALVRLLFEEAGKRDETRIPVLIKLRSHKTSTIALINNFLKSHKIYLNDPEIDSLLSDNRLFVMLDGVNELPSQDAANEVKVFRETYPKVPMVFTTRDLGIWGNLGIEKRLMMQPLTEERMRSFVRGYLGDKGEKLLNQLNNERLKKLGKTPLFLLMLCFVYDEDEKIPDNLGETFRRFTRKHYEQSKSDVKTLAESRLLWSKSLEYLAFEMTKRKDEPAIGVEEAKSIIGQFLQENKENDCSATRQCLWLSDLENHHLIQKLDDDNIEFHHQLIQEYYAAEYLLKRLEGLSPRDLQWRYLNYLKWTEPIALMLGLLKDEKQALRVVGLALAVDLGLGARLAGEVNPSWQEETVKLILELEIPKISRIKLLEKTRSDQAVPILVDNLIDSHECIRRIATSALGPLVTKDSIRLLDKILERPESYAHSHVLVVLSCIDSDLIIPSLQKAICSRIPMIRVYANYLLKQKGIVCKTQNVNEEDLIPYIVGLNFDFPDYDPYVEVIKSSFDIEKLIDALEHSNQWVRNQAMVSIQEIANQQEENLIKKLQYKIYDENYIMKDEFSINTLPQLIVTLENIQKKLGHYALEPMYLPTDSEKKSSIEKASLSETPQSSTSPQIIQNFNFNAPVDTVAGNVQGNLINHKEGKE